MFPKSHKNYSHKKYKNNSVKPNDFYAKKKNVSKKYDKQSSGKGKCFNCGKPGHFSKDCNQRPGKLKNKFNMLNIDNKDQEELFKILESNNSSDSSSTKNVAPPVKSKKKGSPLDAIRKDPDALFALLF